MTETREEIEYQLLVIAVKLLLKDKVTVIEGENTDSAWFLWLN